MSALEAESIALWECLGALGSSDTAKAEVWLRLADDARHARLAGEQIEMFA